ncbi:MAG: hypothetical protein HQ478_15605 [Chloroflexi bacterium]|nr:hypothetical protein [Chloroflexota bacterium]
MSRKTGFTAAAAAIFMVAAIACGSDAEAPGAVDDPLPPTSVVAPTQPAAELTPTVEPALPTVEPTPSIADPTPVIAPTPIVAPTPVPEPTPVVEPTPIVEPTQPVFEDETAFEYNFDNDAEGWETGFADLPANWSPYTYELDAGYRALPSVLSGGGIYLQGHNRSDDLFMYLTKQISGLKPLTQYEIEISIDLVANVPGGLMGIGGSPGESVYVKVGATPSEPIVAANVAGQLLISVDKGQQSNDGSEMVVIGNVSNEEVVDDEYKLKTLDNSYSPLTVTSDADGQLWLIVGTDSGFEGLSNFYYSGIRYDLTISK